MSAGGDTESEYENGDTCTNYNADVLLTDIFLTAFFFFGTYFPLLFMSRGYSLLWKTFSLRLWGTCVQASVIRQRRLVINQRRGHVGHEVFLITVKYPANSRFDEDVVKEFEVSPWTYTLCLRDPLALHVVRDAADPKIAALSYQVYGCFSPICVVFSVLFYGIAMGFAIVWNIMLYSSSTVCHAPVWSIPLAILAVVAARRKDLRSIRSSATIMPAMDNFPEAAIVEEDGEDSDSSNPSIRRIVSVNREDRVVEVPVASPVLSRSERSSESSKTEESSDGDAIPVATQVDYPGSSWRRTRIMDAFRARAHSTSAEHGIHLSLSVVQ